MKDSVSAPLCGGILMLLIRAVRPVQVETKYPLGYADRLLLSVGVSAKIRVSHEYAATYLPVDDNPIDVRLAQAFLAVSGIEYDLCMRHGAGEEALHQWLLGISE